MPTTLHFFLHTNNTFPIHINFLFLNNKIYLQFFKKNVIQQRSPSRIFYILRKTKHKHSCANVLVCGVKVSATHSLEGNLDDKPLTAGDTGHSALASIALSLTLTPLTLYTHVQSWKIKLAKSFSMRNACQARLHHKTILMSYIM